MADCTSCGQLVVPTEEEFMLPPKYTWELPRENVITCQCGVRLKVDSWLPDFGDVDNPAYWWIVSEEQACPLPSS